MENGGMLKNKNLFSLRESFLKGHYDQCLVKFRSYESNPDNYFINENNKFVCESLMNLVSLECQEKIIEALLKLYDNCCVCHSLKTNNVPMHVQLTILFNIQWLALTTKGFSSDDQVLWDRLFSRIVDFCHREVNLTIDGSCKGKSWQLYLDTINRLSRIDIRTTSIFLESILTTLLIRLRINSNEEIAEVMQFVASVSKNTVDFVAKDCMAENQSENILFKFNVNSGPSTYDDIRMETILNNFAIFGCVLSTRLKERPSRYFATDSVKSTPLWHYCEGLRNFEKQELKTALESLLKVSPSSLSDDLQCRYHNLLGRVYSEMGERQKALKSFTTAIQTDKNFGPAHYYQGREFGKMGLVDSMLKSYQNLATKNQNGQKGNFSFEYHLLKILQEQEETSTPIATYLLAVAYGINEMFQDSQTAFEKLLTRENLSAIIDAQQSSFLKIPPTSVVLHEAATINLMNGNLSRAEEICRLAISVYPKEKPIHQETDAHGLKDLKWIRDTLNEEFKMDIDDPIELNTYYEDYLSIFEEDIIGLLILAELVEKCSAEEARLLLNQALLLLSKYIARAQKAANSPENRKQEILIKALACKTCLYIAKMQTNIKPFAEVDKMFKRALSCNNGDKDVLYFYANYLLESSKHSDAVKLWKTFSDKDPILNPESSQSLALRYLLRTHVSQRLMTALSLKITEN